MKRLFISGTDTDIGKTVLSLLLVRTLMDAGLSCVYLKPVQTGCVDPDQDSDPATLARYLPQGLPLGMTPRQCIGVTCPAPKAPLFAKCSTAESTTITNLAAFVRKHDRAEVQIIEGAGGLFVPLNWQETMLDLAAELKAEVLLAARAGLGTINHTLLSIEALRKYQIPCSVILLDPDGLTPEPNIRENIRAIEHFGKVKVCACIGHIADLHTPPVASLRQLEFILNISQ
jgi:dethiobiotin synthetase